MAGFTDSAGMTTWLWERFVMNVARKGVAYRDGPTYIKMRVTPLATILNA